MIRISRMFAVIAVLVLAGGGWWLSDILAPHTHQVVRQTTPEGEVFYTCPMHPQVRQPEPGNCPICGMTLVKKQERSGAESGDDRTVLYWYDPMRPDQHFDAPGKSPFMDMDLLPMYADEAGGAEVNIDPSVVQNFGIRTIKVESGRFAMRVDTVGAVGVDEHRIFAVESRAAGWVERLDVRAVGEPVQRGQVVAGVYAPELYAAQEELLLADSAGDSVLVAASRQRLALLGVSAGQIETVLGTGQARRQVLAHTPLAGVVIELNVREGSRVAPGMPLMRIADLTRIWINVEIPESQGAWITERAAAEVRLVSRPGRVYAGSVEYVYPDLEPRTRTLRARIALDNPDLVFKPGMYADAFWW